MIVDGLQFGLNKDHEEFKTSGDEQTFPKNTSSKTVPATTSANTDRTQRGIQHAGNAGLDNIPLVKKLRC